MIRPHITGNPIFTSSTVIVGDGVGEPCQECDRNLGRLLFSARSLAIANSFLFFETDMNFSMASHCIRHSSYTPPPLHVCATVNSNTPSLLLTPIQFSYARSSLPALYFFENRSKCSFAQPQFRQLRPSEIIVTGNTKETSENYVSKNRHTINPIQRSQLDSTPNVKAEARKRL